MDEALFGASSFPGLNNQKTKVFFKKVNNKSKKIFFIDGPAPTEEQRKLAAKHGATFLNTEYLDTSKPIPGLVLAIGKATPKELIVEGVEFIEEKEVKAPKTQAQ